MQEMRLNFSTNLENERGDVMHATAQRPRKKSGGANGHDESKRRGTLGLGVDAEANDPIAASKMAEYWQESEQGDHPQG